MSVQVPLFDKMGSKSPNVASRVEEVLGAEFGVKEFVENFEFLAEADLGLEQLRAFVLDLARAGRLVPPHASESANLDAWPRVPISKTFTGLSTQGKKVQTSSVKAQGKHPVVDQGQLLIRGYVDDDACVIHPPRAVVVFGDHTRELKYIDFAFVPGADGTKILLPLPDLEPRFFYWMLKSIRLESRGYGRHFSKLLEHSIPLPTIAEQKRIVAKVDQLMALCDDLEARQTKKREVGTRLTKSALEALTTAEGPEEFDAAWKRVVENFPTIIDRAENVALLRGAIRDLAVSGRLLPSAGNLPESRAIGDAPFAIPTGWRWAPLGELAQGTSYGTSQKAHEHVSGVAVLRMNNIQDGRLDLSSLKYVPSDTEKLDELMLAPGDLLFNRTNSYELVGKMAVFRERQPYTFASYLISVRLHLSLAVPEYVNLYFGSSVCRRTQIEPQITRQTNQANFNGTKLKEILVPTPSVDEQKRIVAKAEQLIKVCDDVEAKLRRAEDRAAKLVEAVVKELVA